MDLICGLQCLQELADLLEAEAGAEGEGKSTRYGASAIRPPRKHAVKTRQEVNDGRAPDSNDLAAKSKRKHADLLDELHDGAVETGRTKKKTSATQTAVIRPSKRARPSVTTKPKDQPTAEDNATAAKTVKTFAAVSKDP